MCEQAGRAGGRGRGCLVVAWLGGASSPSPPSAAPSLPLLNPALATLWLSLCQVQLELAFLVGPRVLQLHGAPRAAADPRSGTGAGPRRDPCGPCQVALPAGAAAQPAPGPPTRVSPSLSVVGGAGTGAELPVHPAGDITVAKGSGDKALRKTSQCTKRPTLHGGRDCRVMR